MDGVNQPSYEEPDLGDVISPLLAKWRLLLLVTIVGAAAAFGVSYFLRKSYESTAVIYVPRSSAVNLIRDLPVPVSMFGTSQSGYVVTLLQSETLLRNVIAALRLPTDPDFARRADSLEKMLRRLKRAARIKDDKVGSVSVTVRADRPGLAADIANAMLRSLDKLVVRTSRKKADFISRRLDETVADLDKAEDELLAFQQRHGIAQIDEETRVLIDELSALDGRLLALDVELEELRSELANSGELNTLVEKEVRRNAVESARDYVLARRAQLQSALVGRPAVAIEYVRLKRRIGVLSRTFELLTEQYQLARITQQGEDGDYQVVDWATPKEKAVSPRRALNAALGGLLSFFVAAMAVNLRVASGKRRKGG